MNQNDVRCVGLKVLGSAPECVERANINIIVALLTVDAFVACYYASKSQLWPNV